jgi:hypothetical protein
MDLVELLLVVDQRSTANVFLVSGHRTTAILDLVRAAVLLHDLNAQQNSPNDAPMVSILRCSFAQLRYMSGSLSC